METDQNSSIDLMSISFDLSIGNRVVVQHSLEVGPIGRKMWKQDSFNSLQTKHTDANTHTHIHLALKYCILYKRHNVCLIIFFFFLIKIRLHFRNVVIKGCLPFS